MGRSLLAAAVAGAVMLASAGICTDAAASTSSIICGQHERMVQETSGGTYVLSRPNSFGTAAQFCISASTQPGFRILSNVKYDHGLVQAFPFTGTGCAYDLCSRHTDLPKRVGRLGPATSSWAWGGTSSGIWNAAYDLWFDTRDQVTTQDDGAELMIWLRTPPGYRGGTRVSIGGRRYWFMTWRTSHDGVAWNYIQFRTTSTVHSVSGLRLWPFIHYAIYHHLIHWGWWLTSVHAGYELWSGGQGLATTSFNART